MVIQQQISEKDYAYALAQLAARDKREAAALVAPEAFLQRFLLGIAGGIGVGALFALAWLSA